MMTPKKPNEQYMMQKSRSQIQRDHIDYVTRASMANEDTGEVYQHDIRGRSERY